MSSKFFRLHFTALAAAAGLLSGCAEPKEVGGGANQSPEPSYCSTVTSYPGGVTLTAQANFEYRKVDPTLGLSGNPVTDGISFAEVAVLNAAGATVQCAETNETGGIALTLPTGAGTYTLQVRSRAYNTKIRASVIEDYYANSPYSISSTFSLTNGQTSHDLGTITASARESVSEKIEGGAFNILKQIFRVNQFLRDNSGNAAFVAPKVSAYWKKGHNPYNYFGGSSMISFYRSGHSQLFILGGDGGDVKNTDTDHFDNTIVIHEYAHFLEDVFAGAESPGGSHNGNFIVDPRLAWSEGWANYLQAAVLRTEDPTWQYYIDTVGFVNDSVEAGMGYVQIRIDLTMSGADGKCWPGGSNGKCDRVTYDGEGTFREMAVARFLFKTTLDEDDGGAEVPFARVWSAFSSGDSGGSPVGMGSSQNTFRNIAMFNGFLRSHLLTHNPSLITAWDSIRSEEKQNDHTGDYADSLNSTTENTCAVRNLEPVVDSIYPGLGEYRSNQFHSNDFYTFKHDGTAKTITLEYSGGGSHHDLDLYIYRQDYVYQEADKPSNGSIIASSSRVPASDGGIESVSMAGLPAGTYLINVKANTYGKGSAQLAGASMDYRLKMTKNSITEDLCPAN